MAEPRDIIRRGPRPLQRPHVVVGVPYWENYVLRYGHGESSSLDDLKALHAELGNAIKWLEEQDY